MALVTVKLMHSLFAKARWLNLGIKAVGRSLRLIFLRSIQFSVYLQAMPIYPSYIKFVSSYANGDFMINFAVTIAHLRANCSWVLALRFCTTTDMISQPHCKP